MIHKSVNHWNKCISTTNKFLTIFRMQWCVETLKIWFLTGSVYYTNIWTIYIIAAINIFWLEMDAVQVWNVTNITNTSHVSLGLNLHNWSTIVNVSTKLFLLTALLRVSTFADRWFARPPSIWLACPVLRSPGQKEFILARVHEGVAQCRQVDGPHIHVRWRLRLSARVSYTEQM